MTSAIRILAIAVALASPLSGISLKPAAADGTQRIVSLQLSDGFQAQPIGSTSTFEKSAWTHGVQTVAAELSVHNDFAGMKTTAYAPVIENWDAAAWQSALQTAMNVSVLDETQRRVIGPQMTNWATDLSLTVTPESKFEEIRTVAAELSVHNNFAGMKTTAYASVIEEWNKTVWQ